MSAELYDEDYFLRGRESGKSLYENYRWMPELTVPMAERIVSHLGIVEGERVLDFGCARGYTVKALRQLGHMAYGYDLSRWAIENADPEIRAVVTDDTEAALSVHYDWIIAKDVLEHVEYVEWNVSRLLNVARRGVFVVVPLSPYDGTKYVIEEYERDVTHVQRMTLLSWMKLFIRRDWSTEAAYRIPGIKDNYYKPGWEKGNGFITARRIVE